MNPFRLAPTSIPVMGIPLDNLNAKDVLDHVLDCVARGQRCFLSTPNLSFAMAARSDPQFRDTVVLSDLSVADGMPLVAVARLLGAGFPERIAGSTLFDQLRQPRSGPPVKVYLFGGVDGVAEAAATILNAEKGGVECVGFCNPGFGTIEDMSTPAMIDAINDSGADFLMVALNARRGQAWLAHNIDALRPAVLVQLGATINFVAGAIRRAPPWVQRIGAEWIWRIVEEPKLWRRYAGDGLGLLWILASEILPSLIWLRLYRRRGDSTPPKFDLREDDDRIRLRIAGAWSGIALGGLQPVLERVVMDARPLHFDLSETTNIDGAFLAALMRVEFYRRRAGFETRMTGVGGPLPRIFRAHGAQYLLQVLSEPG